jgi:3-oxoacyl-[acyl-carrier-protein] synthase-3
MAATDVTATRRPLRLRAVVPFVPPGRIAVKDLQDPLGLTDSEIRLYTRFLGLDQIAHVGQSTAADMLLRAADGALAGTDRSRVAYLVHAYTMAVAPAAMRLTGSLRRKLGLDAARAFDMSHQSCVAGLYALKVLEALLRSEPPGTTALLLTGEKVFTDGLRVLRQAAILGDAAAACLVALDGPGDTVLSVAHRTFGEFHRAQNMHPDLLARYNRDYTSMLAAVIREAVHAADLTMDQVSMILPHNVNRYSWSVIARDLSVPIERVYLANVPKTGHCFGADPFVNLATARAEGAVRPGDTLLMASAGEGGTFGAVVLRAGGQEPAE